MNLTEMRQILASGQIQLTKSLGQNFLHDTNQLRRIAAAAELKAEDQVLEIGPGLGPLTELLLEQAGKVLAIEMDERLVAVLLSRWSQEKKLELVPADALAWLRSHPRDWSQWKLVANLPYSVASPLLVDLAQARGCPERIVVTLQLEVAKRLMSTHGSADYGVLTLLVQLHYHADNWFKIPAACFFPAPEVDSACVTLVRRAQPLLPVELQPVFVRLVKLGFSQRRKMLLKLLKQNWPEEKLTRAFGELQLDPKIRGEAVSLEQFAQLTQLLEAERLKA